MKVDLYKYTKIKDEDSRYLFYKTVDLPLIPNVFDHYIDEEVGNYLSVKQRFISERRVVLLLGEWKKTPKYLNVVFDKK